MTMAEQLLQLAKQMSYMDTPVLSVARRRAVSTAYYAVFHAIAELCARDILPDRDGPDNFREFERVYRALEHGSLKNEFSKGPLKDNGQLKEIGELVVQLQSERHKADYLPFGSYGIGGYTVAKLIESAGLAMELLKNLDARDRRTLAVALLFKNRPQ